MTNYAKIPAGASIRVVPFTARVDEERLQHLKKLLELSPVAIPTFENTSNGRRYGLTREWLINAKQVWENEFDWRKFEDRINSFPNFKAPVQDSAGNNVELHFIGLFSEKPDAIPVVFNHCWPGSPHEFLEILDILRTRYSPTELPYHVVVPSLPGYGFSSGPPVDRDYGVDIAASAVNELMVGLGFGSGYLTHGGDLGSFISRTLALSYDACKGMHLSMMPVPPIENPDDLTDDERSVLQKATEVIDTGMAFSFEQGTRTATIGHVLSSSPIALLSWLGEKMLEWTDEDPPIEKILETVTLYWLTDTIPKCLYHSRGMGNPEETPKIGRVSAIASRKPFALPFVEKPSGYSRFAYEIIPTPESWAARTCNLISFNNHEKGGHFAAMEKPKELLDDVEEYVQKAWGRIRPNGVE